MKLKRHTIKKRPMPKTREHTLQNKKNHRASQLGEMTAAYSKTIAALELKIVELQKENGKKSEEVTKNLSANFASSSQTLQARYGEVIEDAKQVSKCIAADVDCGLSPRTMKQTIKNHACNLLAILDV